MDLMEHTSESRPKTFFPVSVSVTGVTETSQPELFLSAITLYARPTIWCPKQTAIIRTRDWSCSIALVKSTSFNIQLFKPGVKESYPSIRNEKLAAWFLCLTVSLIKKWARRSPGSLTAVCQEYCIDFPDVWIFLLVYHIIERKLDVGPFIEIALLELRCTCLKELFVEIANATVFLLSFSHQLITLEDGNMQSGTRGATRALRLAAVPGSNSGPGNFFLEFLNFFP